MLPVTMVWGCSFAAMKVALQSGLSVGAMLALRATLGAACLGLFLWFSRVRVQRRAVIDGLWMGLVMVIVFWLQADGLRFSSTSKSAFITGLYVLFTPMIGLFIGDRLRASHAFAALAACGGLYLLVHIPGAPMGGWNRGDTETLLCAIGCGFQIALTGHFARRSNGLVLAFVQVAALAAASWVLAAIIPSEILPNGSRLGGLSGTLALALQPRALVALLFLGLLATSLAFYLMSTLQAHLGATEAAVIYTLEPVFASLLALSGLVPGIREMLSPLQILGGAVILGAMLLAELGPRFLRRAQNLEPEDAVG